MVSSCDYAASADTGSTTYSKNQSAQKIPTVLNSFFLPRKWASLSRLTVSSAACWPVHVALPILKQRDIFQLDSFFYVFWDPVRYRRFLYRKSISSPTNLFYTDDFFISTEELQIFVIIYVENTYTIIHTENFCCILIVLQFLWK